MLSAVILTKNEEDRIPACLRKFSFCDELLVIDNGSNDQTIQEARRAGATVISLPEIHDFSVLRNAGMKRAKGDWILFVDADEQIDTKLQTEIEMVTKEQADGPGPVAYYLKRRDMFWRTELSHGEVATAATTGIIRLVKKGSGSWCGSVHETFITNGPTGMLHGYIIHTPHPTIASFIHAVNEYSSQRARELKHPMFVSVLLYPFGKFLYTYFLKAGFRDGAAGFAYSFFMSFHSFLARSKSYVSSHD